MTSCSKTSDEVNFTESNLNDTSTLNSFGAVTPRYCFNVSSDQNYNCDWTDGYEDYVYHYNYVKDLLGYNDCYKMILGDSNNPHPANTVAVSSGFIIPNRVKTEFQNYYNYLYSKRNDSAYDQAKFDGYSAYRGKEPLSTNPNCS